MFSPLPLLTATGLGRRIGDRWIWRSLDLTLAAGDRAMLSGPSGAGKSLLLRGLCRLDLLDEGTLAFRRVPVVTTDAPQYRSKILYVQQTPVLTEGTVAENVELPRSFRVHRNRAPGLDRARDLFTALGKPDDFITQRAALLSGGEAQLVGLVRALVLDPTVLLLDEPTAHLDPETTARVEAMVTRWVGQSERAVLWTSHNPEQVDRMRRGPLLHLGATP